MTTLIYIENVLGSGQTIKLTENFGDYSVSRELRPGEHARLVVSPFKAVTVEEVAMAHAARLAAANEGDSLPGLAPPALERRRFG
jgi:hypothetical protein